MQAFAEPSEAEARSVAVDFVNEQVKSIYNGTTRLVAPIALTTFVLVLIMNAMDFLPIDIVSAGLHAIGFEKFRFVPTADVNTTLQQIAEASRARSYNASDAVTIDQVMVDVISNF